jgi:MFS family permease
MTLTDSAPAIPHDPYQALRYRDFRLLISGRLIASLGEQMVSVAIGWELYERTSDPLALGLVGLVQVLPVILLVLATGHAADRFNRKYIVMTSQFVLALCSLGLVLLSSSQGPLWLIYGCLLVIGIARAFNGPAASAFFAQTVPSEVYANAATWSSTSWQLAAVVGPGLGGLLISVFRGAVPIYLLDVVACIVFVILLALIRAQQAARKREVATVKSLLAGLDFLRKTKIILAAITLDMVAVLLGGATALMPVFAKDILQVGPEGLGLLRAAPSVGAVLMAVTLAHLPPFRQAGKTLLWAVVGFGLATIVFGLSNFFWLSLLMLALLGALDNISVVIRGTLLLVYTPDEMRGRIGAVNSVFIGMSNELGGFESGLAARLLGPVLAVVLGGIGTILVVLGVAYVWPEIRQLKQLDGK